MKTQYIPMSVEEFETMEHPFGWKAEYANGKEILSPREILVQTKLSVTPRSLQTNYHLMAIDPAFKSQMIEACYNAFQDSVEFCNWSTEEIWQQMETRLDHFLKGYRGEILPCSVMVIEPDTKDIFGLALFVEKEDEDTEEQQIQLDLLFVSPLYQRKGVATEMVAFATNQLYTNSINNIYSSYHICNTMSQNWHRKFGFQEIYDPFYIKLKYAWFKHEIWRHQKLGLEEKIDGLIKEQEYWFSQLPEAWRY